MGLGGLRCGGSRVTAAGKPGGEMIQLRLAAHEDDNVACTEGQVLSRR